MRITVSNTITIEEPTEKVKEWVKEHLIIPNPEYAKKLKMNFWLGNTPRNLMLYEQHGSNLVLPYGTLKELLEISDTAWIISHFANPGKIDYGPPVPLYDYQQEAVDAMRAAKYGILKSPAGSGKTQMGIALVKAYGRKALWLTHTHDLLQQSKQRAEQYMVPSLIGTITEGKVHIGSGITFATIQTMCRLDLLQYRDVWDVVIVDECHRVAGTPTAMTQFSKVLNHLAARHKFGLSATVHRADDMIEATYALLGRVAYTVPEEAVAERIMKVGIRTVGMKTTLSRECLNADGTLNYTKMITHLCENDERNQVIARYIKREENHPCLILSDRLEHLTSLMAIIYPAMQEEAVMISGKTKKALREKAIEDMRTGKKTYLFATYSLAKEGLDIPRLERLFLTTPQKDYAIITQAIGRIARTHPDKKDPIAYDFVDNIQYLARAYKKRCTIYRKNHCYFVGE